MREEIIYLKYHYKHLVHPSINLYYFNTSKLLVFDCKDFHFKLKLIPLTDKIIIYYKVYQTYKWK